MNKQQDNIVNSSWSRNLTLSFAMLSIFGLLTLGCSGSDGAAGGNGTDGTDGTDSLGLACWDLNGNGVADLASEDTNNDGVVNVFDCRASSPADEALDISDPLNVVQLITDQNILHVQITSVSISSPPVVQFQLADSQGHPVRGVAQGQVRFAIAKLIPASGATPSRWQGYINRIRTTGANAPAVQTTAESSGVLVDNGDGSYQYTFSTDISNVTTPYVVTYQPSLLHRLGIEFSINTDINPDNYVYDFVPDGSSVSYSKNILATATCNDCHQRLTFHGGRRKSAEYCVTCHNVSTKDQNQGEILDMAAMTHAIHASAMKTNDYVVANHNYAEVTFPRDLLKCESCHTASSATPDGDAWKGTLASLACGSCHDDGLVAGTPDPSTGLVSYTFKHLNLGNAVFADGTCETCHAPGTSTTAGSGYFIDPERAHNRGSKAAKAYADENFEFQIAEVTNFAVGQTPQVKFRVWNPSSSTAYNLATDPAFTSSTGTINVRIAWGTDTDYTNIGSASAGVATGAPAQPVNRAKAYLAALTPDGDGYYTAVSPSAVPTGVSNVVVVLDGHPASALDPDGIYNDALPVTSAVYFTDATRREIVSLDKCNACHDSLEFHGVNRNNAIEVCDVCHNSDATDINRRVGAGITWADPSGAADLRGEQSISMGYMIHNIHAANTVLYGFGNVEHDYTHVTYPAKLQTCTNCHVDSSYTTVPEGLRPVTVGTGADRSDPDDDEAISGMTAVCYSCHKTTFAQAHMEQNGGVITDGDPNTSSGAGFAEYGRPLKGEIGTTGATSESCTTCHKVGGLVDPRYVHNILN